MSGTPTEAEVQAQWRNAIGIIESFRAYVDTTLAGAGQKWDVLLQSLEGDYTPSELSRFASAFRSTCSSLLTPGIAASVVTPVLYEYARILSAASVGSFGGGYRSAAEIYSALYEYFHANSLTVQSRNITYDTVATLGAANVGNGAMARLTVDQHNYRLEACHVEKKMFRCRSDANSGTEKWAEVFEQVGQASAFDSVLRASFGSGEAARTTIVSKHAGSGAGGSLLANSSWSEYSATASPKFTGWTESAGGAQVSQDLTTYYRTHPGSSIHGSLKITGGGGTVTLKQVMSAMRTRRLDPNTPYFLRIMVNASAGVASGGNIVLRLGNKSVTTSVASLSAGWNEIILSTGQNCWFRQFNEQPMDIEIEWASSSSGYLLVDDAIFAPWDLIDGTYWCLRQNAASPTAWLVDDTLEFTDTGGAPATGKIQWWLWVSGYGYLPSTTGTPTFTDPT